MVGEGEEAELRDLQLGQVIKLGEVASIIVSLLDGTRDAEGLLKDAGRALGEELNPMGLVELLQALDRRALLDTPRARMVVSQGLVRADIAALQRLARREHMLDDYGDGPDEPAELEIPNMADGSQFACESCNRCCSEQHLLGPVTRAERDAILAGFAELGDHGGSDPSNFIPLPTGAAEPVYLLRPRNGHCVYLGADRLCRVHAELSEEVKPSVCRMFPFRGVRTPLGWDVGLSLSCPTVARGSGPDPRPEAHRTLSALRVISTQLKEVPEAVPVGDGDSIPFADYQLWERETIEQLSQPDIDPAAVWVEAVKGFVVLSGSAQADEATEDIGDDDTLTLDAATVESPREGSEFIPSAGIGDNATDDVDAADILLKDLSFWSELLVGLEAADPMALRRFRSGVLRLRLELGHRPLAAPVLAEEVRLQVRSRIGDDSWAGRDTDEASFAVATDPSMEDVPPAASEATVQARFLAQALMSKRPFEFGSLGRGLIALTVFLAVLRLEELPGDELHPRLEDLAYLVHHPQLTDILDTRATIRSSDRSAGIHSALLGLG